MRRKLSWNERMQKFCCTLPPIQMESLWLSCAKASAEGSVLGRLSQTLNSAIRYLDTSSVQHGTTTSPWILLVGQSYIGFTTGEHESVGSNTLTKRGQRRIAVASDDSSRLHPLSERSIEYMTLRRKASIVAEASSPSYSRKCGATELTTSRLSVSSAYSAR
jgi:hypothetical protein